MAAVPPAASDGASPTSRRGRPAVVAGLAGPKRLDIQGLRAVAVVAVLGFHSTETFTGGFLGVDVFFVISGYIIAWMAVRELRRTGAFDARAFIVRRVRRLVPAMVVVVTAATAGALLLDSPLGLAASVPITAATALLGVSNIHFYAGAVDYFQSFELDPLMNTWSLSVEVQFYLAFALVSAVAIRLARPRARRVAFGLIAVASIGSLTLAMVLLLAPQQVPVTDAASFSFFLPATRLWQFGAGALAALLPGPRRSLPRLVGPASACLLALIGLSAFVFDDAGTIPGVVALLPSVATALLLWIGGHHQGATQRALSHPAVTYLGDRSYSIYLWQGPLIAYGLMLTSSSGVALVAAAASILLGALTYRTVEQRYRGSVRAGHARSWRRGRAISVAGYLSLVLALGLTGTGLQPTIAGWYATAPVRATQLDTDCIRQRADGGFAPCLYGNEGEPRALLIGDSHAAALSEAFIAAANDAGVAAVVATGSACAPYDLAEVVANRPACAGYREHVLEFIGAEDVVAVLVHTYSEFYVDELGVGPDVWSDAVASFLSEVRDLGPEVTILGDTPRALSAVAKPVWADTWSLGLADPRAVREDIERAEVAAADRVQGTRYVPAVPAFCPGGDCVVFDASGWAYTDRDHLSVVGAARLEDELHGLLADAAG